MSRAGRVRIAPILLIFAAGLAVQSLAQGISAGHGTQFVGPAPAGGSWSHGWGANPAAGVVSDHDAPSARVANAKNLPVSPFSRIAISTATGTLGLGAQVATPIARWLNLRGGANLLNFGVVTKIDGATYEAEVHLRTGQVSLDYFPFHWGFHLSPGILIYKSVFAARVDVPGGSTFDLGDVALVSSATDPIHGTAALNFPNTIMPAFTIGFGNMVAREGRHWSVPLEIGLAYSGHYTAQLNLQGTACSALSCQNTTTSEIQGDVKGEENLLNEATKHYQIYPIVTGGVSYRF